MVFSPPIADAEYIAIGIYYSGTIFLFSYKKPNCRSISGIMRLNIKHTGGSIKTRAAANAAASFYKV
jgi:hypothetical protein